MPAALPITRLCLFFTACPEVARRPFLCILKGERSLPRTGVVKVMFDCAFGPESNMKLKLLGLQLMQAVCERSSDGMMKACPVVENIEFHSVSGLTRSCSSTDPICITYEVACTVSRIKLRCAIS